MPLHRNWTYSIVYVLTVRAQPFVSISIFFSHNHKNGICSGNNNNPGWNRYHNFKYNGSMAYWSKSNTVNIHIIFYVPIGWKNRLKKIMEHSNHKSFRVYSWIPRQPVSEKSVPNFIRTCLHRSKRIATRILVKLFFFVTFFFYSLIITDLGEILLKIISKSLYFTIFRLEDYFYIRRT